MKNSERQRAGRQGEGKAAKAKARTNARGAARLRWRRNRGREKLEVEKKMEEWRRSEAESASRALKLVVKADRTLPRPRWPGPRSPRSIVSLPLSPLLSEGETSLSIFLSFFSTSYISVRTTRRYQFHLSQLGYTGWFV